MNAARASQKSQPSYPEALNIVRTGLIILSEKFTSSQPVIRRMRAPPDPVKSESRRTRVRGREDTVERIAGVIPSQKQAGSQNHAIDGYCAQHV